MDFRIEDKYKIITYVDSIGCTSCNLKFAGWKNFMHVVDSLRPDSVQFLFVFFPKKVTEIYQAYCWIDSNIQFVLIKRIH